MNLAEFELERWLPFGEKKCEYNLGGATPPVLKYKDLIDEFDLNRPISYGYTKGSDALRDEIASLSSTQNKENIVVTHGTAEANFLILNYLLGKGDEMVFLVPSYLGAYGIATAIGAKVKTLFLKEEDNYEFNIENLKEVVSKKTKVIFFTNPNNPTATKLSNKEVKAICEVAEDLNTFLIFDEALRGLEIDGVSSSEPVDIYEKGIITRSVSKLGLGGLRIGWIAAKKDIANSCWAIKDYTTLGISSLNEYFAIIALKKEKYEKIIEGQRKNLRTRLEILNKWVDKNQDILSLMPVKAGGSAFPRYKANMNSVELSKMLLEKERVLVSPGDFFLSSQHFRMNYAGSPTTSNETTFKASLEHIESFLKKITN